MQDLKKSVPFPADMPRASKIASLAEAVESGNTSEVEALLRNGADPNATVESGMTVLMTAASRGRTNVASLLIRYGADVNSRRNDGFTALLFGAFFGRTDVVRLLLENGADVKAQTSTGTSAEMWAQARGFREVFTLLQQAKAGNLGVGTSSLVAKLGPQSSVPVQKREPEDIEPPVEHLEPEEQPESVCLETAEGENLPAPLKKTTVVPEDERLLGIRTFCPHTVRRNPTFLLLSKSAHFALALSGGKRLAAVGATAMLVCSLCVYYILQMTHSRRATSSTAIESGPSPATGKLRYPGIGAVASGGSIFQPESEKASPSLTIADSRLSAADPRANKVHVPQAAESIANSNAIGPAQKETTKPPKYLGEQLPPISQANSAEKSPPVSAVTNTIIANSAKEKDQVGAAAAARGEQTTETAQGPVEQGRRSATATGTPKSMNESNSSQSVPSSPSPKKKVIQWP